MSVYSAKTGITSILKSYVPSERDKVKNAMINKVRFTMPKQKGLLDAVYEACENNNFQPVNEFIMFIREIELNDIEFLNLMTNARLVVNELSPKFTNLVESILSLSWTKRNPECVTAYAEFCLDIMVAHTKYIHFGIPTLIALWIPSDIEEEQWLNCNPTEAIRNELSITHKLLDRILTAVPMAFDVVLDAIETMFPYYKKPTHVVAGYLHNVLWLLEYKAIFTEFILHIIMQKLIILDVNAPRNEIEETDGDIDECETSDDDDEAAKLLTRMDADDNEIKLSTYVEESMFEMDDLQNNDQTQMTNNDKYEMAELQLMNHPIAQTMDVCMLKLFEFLDKRNPHVSLNNDENVDKVQRQVEALKFLKLMIRAFDDVILPSHNTHHVQFLIFYYCSFGQTLAETFLSSLWDKIKDPNVSGVIRQSTVGYMASLLARAKFLSIVVVKRYLKELCNWAHQYIDRCDQYRANGSLKANMVFFVVCQAIFYVIAFRSRDLTADKKSLLFLQSLHLSALVTCNFNPLRVCLPAVATAFAGVTRAYQLAYCHAILERNARRKLATIYTNDIATPVETLDTFFPFDPYLLKNSSTHIEPQYLQYRASDAEEYITAATNQMRRKRGDSEMIDDCEIDDFIIADKRQKLREIAMNQEREAQFNYGLSPGFHM